MADSLCFPCPKCGVSNEIPKHYVGKSIRCVGCSDFFTAAASPPSDIKFNCPSCNQSLEAPTELAGQLIDCPSCKNRIQVPILGQAPKVETKPLLPLLPPRWDNGASRVTGNNRFQDSPNIPTSSTNHKQMAGLLGSALLFVGVFCPIITLPIVGQMNYFQNGQGDGTIVLVLAVASAVLAFVRRFPLLWLTGGGSLGLVAFTFIRFQSGISEQKLEMESKLEGNPFAGLARLAVESVQIQWGFAIIVIGAIFVIAAAAMPTKRNV
jgi:hypothetical protein